jgi:TRAP-type C4-dicarboxylate transport system substrate-binding protein
MFQLYGANPTPMAFSEVFTALQTGVIDGQENPYAQIASAKFQEVQDYLSITGHVYTPGYILTGLRTFTGLDPEVQQALREAARETQAYVYETAERMENELLDVIKAAGVQVNEADKAAFVAASQPIYEEFAATVEGGAALVERVNAVRPATN